MPINKNDITKEMIAKAMQCETAEELIALAKAEGIELTFPWQLQNDWSTNTPRIPGRIFFVKVIKPRIIMCIKYSRRPVFVTEIIAKSRSRKK